MTHETRLTDVHVGTIDGARMMVAPHYQGTLTESDRRSLIAAAARAATGVLDDDRAGTAYPADVRSFRLHFSDLLYLTLNFGLVPSDMGETVRTVGAALGIHHTDVELLVAELSQCIHKYRLASRLVPGGAWLFDDEESEPVRYISWRDVAWSA